MARIQLVRPVDGRRKFKAHLAGVKDDKVMLEQDGEIYEIPFDSIDKARLVPEFENIFKKRLKTGNGE